MTKVFISYSRKDEEFARQIATDLDRLGASIWLDVDDIPPGVNWSSAIQQGLDNCDTLLLVVSPDSMDSSNVTDEWQYFRDEGKPIIPIMHRSTANAPFPTAAYPVRGFCRRRITRSRSASYASGCSAKITRRPAKPDVKPCPA